MTRRQFAAAGGAALAAGALGCAGTRTAPGVTHGVTDNGRPNILWIVAEDACPDLGCYGHPVVRTPVIDRLAAEGLRFESAFATGAVCSAARSAFQTGMYQTSIGAHHHRSHRDDGYSLPDGVLPVSHIFREHGYFTTNASTNDGLHFTGGKQDLNFHSEDLFDGVDWRDRPAAAPFFAQVNLFEAHRGFPWDLVRQKEQRRIDPADVEVPPYYPNYPVVRENIATYLEVMEELDRKVGAILDRLAEDGLAENTVVFFFADHGKCLIRGKQWLYETGIRVPLIVRWPGQLDAASVREDPVSLIDVTAASLNLAGIPVPDTMEGIPVLGPGARSRDRVFAARDRCDETRDRVRCVRTDRWKYIRNFMPERPYTQRNRYIEGSYPTLALMKELGERGELTREQSLFLAPRKPEEELYDLHADPHEVRNLAGSAEHRQTLESMRTSLEEWIKETGDQGRFPEAVTAILDEYGLLLDEYK